MKNINENYVRKIIQVGEYLIKNAESLAGTENGYIEIVISAYISEDKNPEINVTKDIKLGQKNEDIELAERTDI